MNVTNTLGIKLEITESGDPKATLQSVATSLTEVDKAQQAVAESAAASTTAEQGNAAAIAATGESAAATEARLKAMVAASLSRQGAEMAGQASTAAATAITADQSAEYERLVAAQNRAMASTSAFVRAENDVAAATARSIGFAKQQADLSALISKIDPAVGALEKLDAQQEKLNAFKAAGAIGEDDFAKYTADIEAARVKITSADDAISHFTFNSSAARREYGRLASDIANGNWGRFEQSFATLANSTGLLTLAFSPLGAAIAATVGVTALLVGGYAKGVAESEALRVSTIATGNAAGITGAAFGGIANQVGVATGKFGDAYDAISVFSKSTKVAGVDVQTLATAAIDMATVTGESASKAAAQILALGQDPAQAVAKLNDQYNFLTASQYAQIAALQESGNADQASAVAQGLAATAFKDRAQEVQDGSGWIISAAHSVASAWDGAWDSIKGAGRTPTLGDKSALLQSQIAALQVGTTLPNGIYQPGASADDPRIASLQAQLNDVQRQQVAAGFKASNDALIAKGNQDSIAAQQRLSKYKTPKEQLDASLAQANADKLAALYGIVDPATKAKIQSEYQQQVDEANKAYADATKQKKAPADPFNALNNLVQKAQVDDNNYGLGDGQQAKQVNDILAIVDAGAKLIQSGHDITKVQAEVAAGVGAVNDLFAKQADQLEQKNQAALKAYGLALDKESESMQRQVDNQLARITMGDKEYQQQEQLNAIYLKQADALDDVAKKQLEYASTFGKSGYSQADADAATALIYAHTQRDVAIQKAGFDAVTAAQANWETGAITSLTNVSDTGMNLAAGMGSAITGAFNDMTSAVVNFANTGKFSLEAFATDFVDAVIKMEVQAAEAQASTGLLSFLGIGSTGTAGSGDGGGFFGLDYGTLGAGGGQSGGLFGGLFAEGGAIKGPGTGTSDSVLIAASNGEYMQTADAHAHYGTAFMDAIRAKRIPRFATGGPINGTYGAMGSAQPPQVIINNNNGSDVQASTQQQPDGSFLTNIVINAVVKDMLRGGQTTKAMEQRYGLTRRGVQVAGG